MRLPPPDVKKVNKQRFRLLEVLYTNRHHHHDERALYKINDIRSEADLDEPSFQRAFRFLVEVGYVEGNVHGGVGITTSGMIAYEAAMSQPELATDTFPPVNIIFAENINNSTIQQAGSTSEQDAAVSGKGKKR